MMGLFGFIRGNSFTHFMSSAERLQAVLAGMKADAKAQNYAALKEKTAAAIRILGQHTADKKRMIGLWQQQTSYISACHNSHEKTTAEALHNNLRNCWRKLLQELPLIEDIAQKRSKEQSGDDLIKKITKLEQITTSMRGLARQLEGAYKAAKKATSQNQQKKYAA